MMYEESADRLTSIASVRGDNNIFDKLSKYMIMIKLDENDISNYTVSAPNGTNSDFINTYVDSGNNFYQLKDGSLMITTSGNVGIQASGAYKGEISLIAYDINGINGNNIAGKEVFLFAVDDSGILIPYHSNIWKNMSIDKDNGDTCDMSSSFEWDGFACTGKIADNGWKADY